MYPSRDFQHLITQPIDLIRQSEPILIRALAREPFPEILRYWSDSQKPNNLLHIYCKGIEDAVGRDRYPLYQLQSVEDYPEFWSSVLNGLRRLWNSLRFSLSSDSLLINSINGRDIDISSDDKLHILRIIPYHMSLILSINGEYKTVGIFTSRRAEHIYQQVLRLQKLLE